MNCWIFSFFLFPSHTVKCPLFPLPPPLMPPKFTSSSLNCWFFKVYKYTNKFLPTFLMATYFKGIMGSYIAGGVSQLSRKKWDQFPNSQNISHLQQNLPPNYSFYTYSAWIYSITWLYKISIVPLPNFIDLLSLNSLNNPQPRVESQ